ncbi:MAG: TrkH family potassium uptake protein [Lachnospiraceae bacterium]|nr:TrkH family potassium uptake protein [Lachnospiraceae bacterium]MBR5765193.1 TrkH family potassium uptake protein [Lachnospiraceae bacterium]MBR6469943.1 TrkH family potassium uptake protein [Lachnospiraceae bacterium]
MNSSIVRYTLGQVLKIEAVLLLLPCMIALIYMESKGICFLVVAAICAFLGFGMTILKPESNLFYLKEGCIITSLSWIFLSFFGALPFYLSGEIPSLTDALFETVSGFTTTGASILSEVESLSKCVTFWRCFTHWIGGMGVLVFLLAIIPIGGGSQINIMKAESPGPSVGKLVPKIRSTARILYIIYFCLTVAEVIFLMAGGMSLFNSVCTATATAGTGGFGVMNDSLAGFSPYIQWVVTIFMILFGVNFNAYYLVVFNQVRKALTMEEVVHYFAIILIAIGIIFTRIVGSYAHAADALRDTAFQVASIITTTGFSTVDFDKWPAVCQTVLVFLMFIGACAGSTGGGIKVSRLIILRKTIIKEMTSYVHPKSIKKIKMDDKPVEHEVVRATNVFFITFVIIFSVSVLIVSIDGNDLITNFTAVAATINNIGPGLSKVGPALNYGHFSIFSKYVLMFDMIAGRLELFPLLMLFHPEMWKELFAHYIRKFSK